MADENVPAKKVDEDWKRKMAEERELQQQQAKAAAARPAKGTPPPAAGVPDAAPGAEPGDAPPPPEPPPNPGAPEAGAESSRPDPRFLQFLQGVAAQALMAMGQIEGMPEPDLRQAKMVIDTLVMIEEKTRGNLSRDEERALKGLMQELQSVYVQMAM